MEPTKTHPQIYVSGREYKVPGPYVTYDEIVNVWNELHAQGTRNAQ